MLIRMWLAFVEGHYVMSLVRLGHGSLSGLRAMLLGIAVAVTLAACAGAPQLPPSEQPLSKEAMMLLGRKGMQQGAPIFIRIFKEESELEVWKARDDGRFYHYKTYPICNWSGELGPKVAQGDKQAPEGFYTVAKYQMNPNSSFHIAFNLGYPNAYDKARNRTGNFLMVHGKCRSAGCYAMTDALMEEIYALAREAFRGGQETFQVHAFPFRMTDANMERHKKHKWYRFWETLKEGYDHFDAHRIPPNVVVCQRRYVVNVAWPSDRSLDPTGYCPRFNRPNIEPFVPRPSEEQIAFETIKARGPKMRTVASNGVPKLVPYGLGMNQSLENQSTPASASTNPLAALGF